MHHIPLTDNDKKQPEESRMYQPKTGIYRDKNEPFDGEVDPDLLGTMTVADPKAAQAVIDASVNTGNGRSHWYWVRLVNGDLMLACYPQGDTYFDTEADPNRP
jgi:hypothetical protein